jgi:hypothetical protein
MNQEPEPLVLSPLPDLPPGDVLEEEWNTFRRELPRLLADGHQGRCALVKGKAVDSVWDTDADALQAGYERFGLTTFMVQQVLADERPLRIRGYY